MTPDLARADRAEAVRGAARGWHRAGVLDDAALAAIAVRFPDDRVRVGPVFRVLLFLFTLVAVNACFGLVAALLAVGGFRDRGKVFVVLALLAGGALVGLTDFQINRLRRRQGGTEAATSLMALGYLLGVAAWIFWIEHNGSWSAGLSIFFLIGAVLFAAAAWRWGYPLYAGAAAAGLLVVLARLPMGRLLWIVLPLVAAPVLLRLSGSPRLPPAHRDSWTAVLLVALTALYLAVHVGSWRGRLIEDLADLKLDPAPASGLLFQLSAAATALVPVVLLVLGLCLRRYPLLLVGAGTAVASLVTLRYYVHLAPLWVVLTLSGLALLAVVFALRRYLESGPDGERHGFTAAPLFEDLARQHLLEAGVAAVTFAPHARSLHEEPKFEGGGGEFGGGGASGQF